jgi:hypothetical protein
MTKRTGKAKKKAVPKKDRAWFERKVAELKAEAEKLPADRQEQLTRELEDEGDRKQRWRAAGPSPGVSAGGGLTAPPR